MELSRENRRRWKRGRQKRGDEALRDLQLNLIRLLTDFEVGRDDWSEAFKEIDQRVTKPPTPMPKKTLNLSQTSVGDWFEDNKWCYSCQWFTLSIVWVFMCLEELCSLSIVSSYEDVIPAKIARVEVLWLRRLRALCSCDSGSRQIGWSVDSIYQVGGAQRGCSLGL